MAFTTPSGLGVDLPFVSTSKPIRVFAPPTLALLSHGTRLRAQAVYVDGRVPSTRLPLMVTNQCAWVVDSTPTFVVEAVGADSRNDDTSSGFFRIVYKNREHDAPTITGVVFDWSQVQGSAPAFDIDQSGMGDAFDAGNSSVPGCAGTYRNDCDTRCGLVYDALNTPPLSACAVAGNANTGFIASNPDLAPGAYKTLEFRFVPSEFVDRVFEFDCDTDGGAGVSGGDMAGMEVRVTLSDGTTRTRVLVLDANDPLRSFANFDR